MKKDRIAIEIDGKALEPTRDTSVLAAALDAGLQIPYFCYHKKLSVTASCRMCLVEVEGTSRLQPA
ncbi:MAG: (2Fe-2S)-binding protein, partial [Burkholderiaceae bacterium]|nr:(2Fe-2S)-binding protein [Burkholderiaceae bacterium]